MDENALIFQQVRSAIQALDLARAEELLNGVEGHCAEWHFLMGAVYYRKGWMDEARKHYEAAEKLEPENQEYRQGAEQMRAQTHYSPEGTMESTLDAVLPMAMACGVIGLGGFCACRFFTHCCCDCGAKSCLNGCTCCVTCGYMDGVGSPPYEGYCFS